MSDNILQISLATLSIITNYIVWKRTKRLSNPLFIITLTFFVPLFFSTFRLSDFQSRHWHQESYLLILYSIALWMIVPFIVLSTITQHNTNVTYSRFYWFTRRYNSDLFIYATRIIFLIYAVSFIVSNKIITGAFFPIMQPALAFKHHASSVPGIQIIARCGFSIASIQFVIYYYKRKRIDIFLLLITILIPFTKLARLEFFLTSISLIILNAFLPVVSINKKKLIAISIIIATTIVGLSALGQSRLNRFGEYSLSYSKLIKYNGYIGPAESIAIAYGYFSLPFENMDRFIQNNTNNWTYGAISMAPMFSSFLFIDNIVDGYPDFKIIRERSNFVTTAATVPSALSYYYLDFGLYLAWMPMAIYMCMWLFLYYKSNTHPIFLLAYSTISASFALSSFQSAVSAPFIYQGIFWSIIPFALTRIATKQALNKTHPRQSAQ